MTYSIIKADTIKYREQILALLKENLQDFSLEQYRWKYEESLNGQASCWLIQQTESNSFVGTAAIFPRKMYIDGQAVLAGVRGDFAVSKKHRILGPALNLQKEMKSSVNQHGFDLLYGIPNQLAKPLFVRLGYDEASEYKCFIKVLKVEYKTGTYLPPSIITRPFSPLIDVPLRMLSREILHKRPTDIDIDMPSVFDHRFNTFWESVFRDFHIIGERTSDFLNWRFIQSPSRSYNIFSINKSGQILGYIVYYIKDNRSHIEDILFFKSSEILKCLLSEFILHMRKIKIGSIAINYLGSSFLTDTLKQFNFIEYGKESAVVFFYTANNALKPKLHQKENWHFLRGDNDI